MTESCGNCGTFSGGPLDGENVPADVWGTEGCSWWRQAWVNQGIRGWYDHTPTGMVWVQRPDPSVTPSDTVG